MAEKKRATKKEVTDRFEVFCRGFAEKAVELGVWSPAPAAPGTSEGRNE